MKPKAQPRRVRPRPTAQRQGPGIRGVWPLAIVLVLAAAFLSWWFRSSKPPQPERSSVTADATYVGAETCATCHRDQYTAWHTSQHRLAMQPAQSPNVEGDFNSATFTSPNGIVSTFFQKDGRFIVRTDGPDGKLTEFPIGYTFGVAPLQQYLIALPGGRLQALSIAWDARPRQEGGQRWFSLYPGEHIDHTDELHWTGRQQNWNFMCADCHSTGLRKQYDASTDTFRTSWAALDVSCEACHGPGSRHVAWARTAPSGPASVAAASSAQDDGLTIKLRERQGVTWGVDPVSSHPVRSTPRTTSNEIQMCAVCHSRRAQVADGYVPGDRFDDFYEAATLEPSLYYADGQQHDEVYVYGSFLQSRMAHAGVTCSDCHDPHTAQVRASGNALCTRCHVAARYDTPSHHFHQAGTAGASCVSCHMPARTYMQIDSRVDHSLRVPRPDLTVTTGAPNACNSCHTRETAAWAAAKIQSWYGHAPSGFQDFAQAFHDFDSGRRDATSAVVRIAESADEPSIVRASALARLEATPSAIGTARQALGDADPMVRRAALQVLEQVQPSDRVGVIGSLLADPSRTVRMVAARLIAPVAAHLIGDDRTHFDRAAAEFVASEQYNADRPEHRLTLGTFLADEGRAADAEAEDRAAIRMSPLSAVAYVNLADLFRAEGREAEAQALLHTGLTQVPSGADLHYALGLSLIRSHQPADGLAELERATRLAPAVARFAYAYALALNGAGRASDAIRVLTSTLAAHPDDRDVLMALAAFERDAGRLPAAREHAARLLARNPDDGEARALAESVRLPAP